MRVMSDEQMQESFNIRVSLNSRLGTQHSLVGRLRIELTPVSRAFRSMQVMKSFQIWESRFLFRSFVVVVGVWALLATSLSAQVPQPDGGGVRPGVLPKAWLLGGPKCIEIPEFQVHEYNEDFYILRQSGCSNYEKPFLFLMFGKEKALLLDTGAGK